MTDDTPLPGMIGAHPAMRAVYTLARRVAPTDLSAVIQGPTGTGKELVAQAIHSLSEFARGPFVDVNCAAMPEGLIEAELFGSERGAYTGAVQRTPGLLELANNGTLFLDEACSLKPVVQSKLLRAIEQRRFRRVGGRAIIETRFRMVMAMTRPIDLLVQAGDYLPAFAHRVNGVEIRLPPLSSRGADIHLLAVHFLAEVAATTGRLLAWTAPALAELQSMAWPGNVRELRAVVSRLPLHVEGSEVTITALHAATSRPSPTLLTLSAMKAAVERHAGNFSRAAVDLGIPRSTLRDKLLR